MKAWLSGQNMMFYILSALTVAGIIVQAVTNHVYKRLIKASEHVEQTDNRLIKYIKLKYSSFYKIGISPNDGQAMVRKYFEKYKLGPMTLSSWTRCGILFSGLILLCTCVNILYEIYRGHALTDSVQTVMICVAALCILLTHCRLCAFDEKKNTFLVSMDDYIQNYLKNKIEYGKTLDTKTSNQQAKVAATSLERRRSELRDASKKRSEVGHRDTEDELDARIVEDILKEFLN